MENQKNSTIEDHQIIKWEKEWQNSQPQITDRELLEIFPEARFYLKERLENLKKESEKLADEIQKNLKRIYKNIKDEFAVWFNEEIVRVWWGKNLNQLSREISKLEWLLHPKKVKGQITDSMIEQARNYPFKDLVGTQKDFILCPFHKEKRPSFYIKNNWGYCFSCGYHADTIKFLQDRDHLSFQEAVKKLT